MLRTHWILAVLEDLRAYADAQGLPELSRHLNRTSEVARRELAGRDGPPSSPAAPTGGTRQE